MLIFIDSNEFIAGIIRSDQAAEKLMSLLPSLSVIIPRFVAREAGN